MMAARLLVASLLVIGLSGSGLAVYAAAPDIASSAQGTVLANLSNPVERINAKSSEPDHITLDSSETISETETVTGSLKIATAIIILAAGTDAFRRQRKPQALTPSTEIRLLTTN